MASLGDVFLRILADANGFEADIVKKAGPAVDKAGPTLGKRMAKGLGTAFASGIGAIGGAAFAAAIVGANQLDAATRQLQADTGMTATEATQAEHALAGMYRNNLQGFDAIGAAMAKVHNDLGLTGDAANAATQEFLDFSTATGQDAAEAVTQADDTLDAWNLTADHANELLDKLIVSHQKYGGSISETQAALNKMAPALTGFGMNLDDGIALLNLFNAAGIDAAKMPQALAQALKKVKTPAEFQRLLKEIAATEDPFLRAQRAVALFGNRAGPQLAAALAASGGDLSAFGINMDDAAGATQKAADAVKSGFGAQFQLLIKNAGGALAEFGTQFGPLVMVASAVGPKFAGALGASLGGLGGFLAKTVAPKVAAAIGIGVAEGVTDGAAKGAAEAATSSAVTKAAGGLGTTMGTAAGKAMSLAIGAAVVLGVAELADLAKPYLDDLAKQIHEAVFGWMPELPNPNDLPWPFGTKGTPDVNLGPFEHIFGGDSIPKAAGAAGAGAGQAFTDGVASKVGSGKDYVGDAATVMMSGLAPAVTAATAAAKTSASYVPSEIAAGIASKRSAIDAAMADLKAGIEHPLSTTGEIAKLAGMLASSELVKGMQLNDPQVKAQAYATKRLITDRLAELKPDATTWGKESAAALAKALKSPNADVRASAEWLRSLVEKGIAPLPGTAAATGAASAAQLAGALDSKDARAKVSGAVSRLLAASEQSWWRGKDSAVTINVTATAPNAGRVVRRAEGGPLMPGEAAWVGERGPELFVPKAPGVVVPHDASVAAATPSVTNINVPITGLLRAASPFEVANQLRRMVDFGVMTPRRGVA